MKARYVHDLHTTRADLLLGGILVFYTTKEGVFQLDYNFITENWAGQEFNLAQFNLNAALRLDKRLKISGTYSYGDRVYYEGNPAFKGKANEGWISFDIQPTTRINQYFKYTHSDFSSNGTDIYDVDILYSKTRYQFNKYFFLRAIFQYNSYQKRLLTDFLASFTLIPGTVFHVGYGELYECRKWQNQQWVYQQGDLVNIKRSFFLKASCLWRF
ncbi:MAG: hypothetical protein JSV88_33020 [Candidatus Aminicenantes bacterium]|nr:MAG: hypothetical protein JSV88_33020 [Candidatus Aminicenantes bacterium]